jgi:hypothetical protein
MLGLFHHNIKVFADGKDFKTETTPVIEILLEKINTRLVSG